jgi:hypothetical protein
MNFFHEKVTFAGYWLICICKYVQCTLYTVRRNHCTGETASYYVPQKEIIFAEFVDRITLKFSKLSILLEEILIELLIKKGVRFARISACLSYKQRAGQATGTHTTPIGTQR